MSETEKPQPGPDEAKQSGAEAPTQPEQPTVAAEAQQQAPPAQEPPVPPAPRRPPRQVRTWVAAAIGAALLLGGGVGGYFIGAANDHDRRPGFSRGGDHGPGDFRGERPFRFDRPDR